MRFEIIDSIVAIVESSGKERIVDAIDPHENADGLNQDQEDDEEEEGSPRSNVQTLRVVTWTCMKPAGPCREGASAGSDRNSMLPRIKRGHLAFEAGTV